MAGSTGVPETVLFVLPSLAGGGAERVAVHLINGLERARFTPVLALGMVEGPYLADLREDVPVQSLAVKQARSAAPLILKAVRQHRPRAVFSTLGFNFAAALARPFFPRGTRLVMREGSTSSAYLREVRLTSPLRAAAYRLAFRMLYGRADAVICQSDHMRRDLAESMRVAERKLVRIYNPVDLERVEALAGESEGVYEGPGPHLVTVGNMTYAKGCDILIEALARVVESRPGARLTIVGEGKNRPEMEALAGKLGLNDAVRFTGFQANPFPYVKQADLFVSSSRYEGIANVVLEALACGTPVVATDCPSGIREVIHEGENGWLAQPGDVTSLAETLLRALSERDRLDPRGIREGCAEQFSVDRITRQFEALL